MRLATRCIIAIAVLASPAILQSSASRLDAAPLQLRVSVDGNLLLDVIDNNLPDNNPTIGVIGVGGPGTPILVSGLQFSGLVAQSNAPGGVTSLLNGQGLNIVNTSGASHTALLEVSDAAFTLPASPLALFGSVSGTFSPATGPGGASTVDGAAARARAWADNTNTKFGTQFLVQDFTAPAAAGQPLLSYANTVSAGGFAFTTNYAMTTRLDLTIPNGVQLNSHTNAILAAVPEPTLLCMIAVPLSVLATRGRRVAARPCGHR